MPIYCYKCPVCGETYDDVQTKMTGTRELLCVVCSDFQTDVFMDRDFAAEKPGVIKDWEPGYNVGIDEYYTSKGDLLQKLRRKGFYGSREGGGVSVSGSKSGLYGDEEFRNLHEASKSENI